VPSLVRVLVAAAVVACGGCGPRSLGSLITGSGPDAAPEAGEADSDRGKPVDPGPDSGAPSPLDAGEAGQRDALPEAPAPPAAVRVWEPAGAPDAGLPPALSAVGVSIGEVVVGTTAGQVFSAMGDLTHPSWLRVDTFSQAGRTFNLPALPVTSVVVDPRDTHTIYVAFAGSTLGHKVYKTQTGGSMWTELGGGLDSLSTRDVWSLSINPQDTQRLYAVTPDAVWYTGDGGASWSLSPPPGDPLHPDFAEPTVHISAVARGRDDNELWVGGTDGEICYTRNAAANAWSAIAGPAMPARLITRIAAYVDPAAAAQATDAATVYVTFAGISNDSVWRSPDNGAGWVNIHGPDLPTSAGPLMAAGLFGVSINPAFPDTLYLMEAGGAHRSDDGGLRWWLTR
jgi:hypothetical protein